jgi:hypothetical protein
MAARLKCDPIGKRYLGRDNFEKEAVYMICLIRRGLITRILWNIIEVLQTHLYLSLNTLLWRSMLMHLPRSLVCSMKKDS